MARERVLLLGVCGIEKGDIAERLAGWFKAQGHPSPLIVDFEKHHLGKTLGKPFPNFLRDPPHEQFRQWRKGWDHFTETFTSKKEGKEDAVHFDRLGGTVLLLLHGAIVREDYGVRAVYDIDCLRRFKPDLIITLIDDVYDLWWRTESREGGQWLGRPTLEQLLAARRTEQLVGDQIANHVQTDRPCDHVVLSVHHPQQSAARLILGEPGIVYMAFPISEPRRMLRDQATDRGIELVNRFHEEAFAHQASTPHVVFVSPLGIDERPLSDMLQESETQQSAEGKDPAKVPPVNFVREARRWPTAKFWPPEDVLTPGPVSTAQREAIPYEQLLNAAGAIRTDVAWRDYRLVLQADVLAIFNPVINKRVEIAGGVLREFDYAWSSGKPVFVFQDPGECSKKFKHDAVIRTVTGGDRSSMGGSLRHLEECGSVEQLVRRAAARAVQIAQERAVRAQ